MAQGRIKKIVLEKGFGFIDGEKGDTFFHHSAVEGTRFDDLLEGQMVEFELGQGPKGSRAEHVRIVEGAE